MTLKNAETTPRTAHEVLPSLRLWSAVIRCAANDLFDTGALRTKALAWFYDFAEGPGSFLWCCDVFNLDPGSVRRAVDEGRVRRVSSRTERESREDPDEEV